MWPQIGIVDVLRDDYGIRPAGILGHSAGVWALPYPHVTLQRSCCGVRTCALQACTSYMQSFVSHWVSVANGAGSSRKSRLLPQSISVTDPHCR